METQNDVLIYFYDYGRLINLILCLILNLIVLSSIVIPKFFMNQRKEFAVSLYLFNFVVFTLSYMLASTEVSFGVGIGLFAVFAMLRFRSDVLSMQDMTYLLVVICIGLMNALASGSVSFVEIMLLNVGILAMVYILDSMLAQTKLKVKKVKYDNLDLIKPERNIELVRDLSAKTGLDIVKVRIDSIDLNEHIANVKIYYREHESKIISGGNGQSAIAHKILNLFHRKRSNEFHPHTDHVKETPVHPLN